MEKKDGYWVVYEAGITRWPRRYDSHKEFTEKKDKEGGHVVDLGLDREAAQRLCLEHTNETLADKCLRGIYDQNPQDSTHQRIHSSDTLFSDHDF